MFEEQHTGESGSFLVLSKAGGMSEVVDKYGAVVMLGCGFNGKMVSLILPVM